jgi:hypothetical protein
MPDGIRIDDLAKRIARLSPAKRALFDKRVKELTKPLARSDVASGSVASLCQEVIMASERRGPSGTWTHATRFRVRGALDAARLRDAVALLAEEQESLRQVWTGATGRLVRAEAVPFDRIRVADDTAIDRIADEQANAAFRLDGSPLARFFVLERSSEDSVLLVTHSHAVHDPTESAMIVSQLLARYVALASGPVAPRAQPLRYVDFAAWERASFEGDGRAHVDVARKSLAGAAPLELADRPRRGPVSAAFLERGFTLGREEAERFERMCRSLSVSGFMAVVAILTVLLARWSHETDVTFMAPINVRRMRPELAGVLGRFANWIPIRLSIDGDPTLAELLHRARVACLAAYAHEGVPAPLVYGDADVFAHPLCRVLLNSTYADGATTKTPPAAAGLAIAAERVHPRSGARNDLAFVLVRKADGLLGFLRASADLYDPETVKRRIEDVRSLLLTFDPSRRVSTLEGI